MAKRCAFSGKSHIVGNKVSHANNKTKRKLYANLRTMKITLEDGTRKKVKIAASTLRTMRKQS